MKLVMNVFTFLVALAIAVPAAGILTLYLTCEHILPFLVTL